MQRSALLLLATAALLAGCDASSPVQAGRSASMDRGGNADAAHACQHGGYLNLMQVDGTRFDNVGDCVSYAAGGGTLTPIPVGPVITSFAQTGTDNFGSPIVTAVFSGATTGVVTTSNNCARPTTVTSGVPAALNGAAGGFVILTVTNAQGSAQASIYLGNSICA